VPAPESPVILAPPIAPGQQATMGGNAVSYPVRAIRVHMPGRLVLPDELVADLERSDRAVRARQVAGLLRDLIGEAREAVPELDLRAAVMIDTRPGAGR
jgi:hypothetical protein